MIEHYWKSDIFGRENWFSFVEIYRRIIDSCPSGGHIVEIGSYLGRSTSYLVVEAQKKDFRLDVVDTWLGSGEHKNMDEVKSGRLFGMFVDNIRPLIDRINIIRAESQRAVRMYDDESLDAVFIDADHSYESVSSDIREWFKKVKHGGIIAGDDYFAYQGVRRAVDELLPGAEIIQRSWILVK